MMAVAERHLAGKLPTAIAVETSVGAEAERLPPWMLRGCIPQAIRCPTLFGRCRGRRPGDAREPDPGDLLIVPLSGGASAMMAAPADPVTLEDKIAVSAALLRVRASIGEINVVRKHLSAIKGGQLLRLATARGS